MAVTLRFTFSQQFFAGYNGVMRHSKSLSLVQFLPQVFSSNQLLGTVA
ncbi:hypothetical protein PPHE_a0973 [Pseudoalteromonas phenolica O-BC30]|nr:hypothetical protein [Pseudoalteromonas phenolica O-BC30]